MTSQESSPRQGTGPFGIGIRFQYLNGGRESFSPWLDSENFYEKTHFSVDKDAFLRYSPLLSSRSPPPLLLSSLAPPPTSNLSKSLSRKETSGKDLESWLDWGGGCRDEGLCFLFFFASLLTPEEDEEEVEEEASCSNGSKMPINAENEVNRILLSFSLEFFRT